MDDLARAVVIADGRSFDRLALDAAVERTTRRLAALGVEAGDRVAVALPGGLKLATLVRALPALAAVLVPLDPRAGARERSALAAQCGATLVIDAPLEGAEADVTARAEPAPHSLRTIVFTSGTSGLPKPVPLTYANHDASAHASALNLGVRADDRWLCCLPVHHVGGLSILLRAEHDHSAVEIHPRFDVDAVMASLEGGVTLVSLVPTMLSRLIDAGLGRPPRLRAALVGGAPAPRGLLDWAEATGFPLLATYGMTETASQIVTASPDDPPPSGEEVAGRPLAGVGLRIGRGGEILVRGPMVCAAALDPSDGWLHTRDRGRLEPDGRLAVEGRLDDAIVSGGENVAPAEVEAALLAHPAVTDAGVVGVADPEWGQAVTAFVVLSAEVGEAELIAHCQARLAAHKVPKAIHRAGELPRTASGKLRRAALR